MIVLFYISDNLVWNDRVKKKLFKYFEKYIPQKKHANVMIILENKKYYDDLKKFVVQYRSIEKKLWIKVTDFSNKYLKDMELFDELLKKTYLIVIERNIREGIVKYIPYWFKGKFKFI